ncbi:MAG: non-canonical purine NTP pyrophosphatase [Ilumatobacteraceae bacterium]
MTARRDVVVTLVCASANPDKVAEIEALLSGAVTLLPRPADVPDVVEDAATLEGNARLKATAVAVATGRPAVADDTGLEVAALAGRPGVRTARYAGEHATYADNRLRLLEELDGVADRRARFRTVAAIVWPDGDELLVDGSCDGTIASIERGTGGFGYDAVFVPDGGDGRTFAEIGTETKQQLSSRGRAFRALLRALADRG